MYHDDVLALQELPETGGNAASPDLFGLTSYFSVETDCASTTVHVGTSTM